MVETLPLGNSVTGRRRWFLWSGSSRLLSFLKDQRGISKCKCVFVHSRLESLKEICQLDGCLSWASHACLPTKVEEAELSLLFDCTLMTCSKQFLPVLSISCKPAASSHCACPASCASWQAACWTAKDWWCGTSKWPSCSLLCPIQDLRHTKATPTAVEDALCAWQHKSTTW